MSRIESMNDRQMRDEVRENRKNRRVETRKDKQWSGQQGGGGGNGEGKGNGGSSSSGGSSGSGQQVQQQRGGGKGFGSERQQKRAEFVQRRDRARDVRMRG